MSETDTADWKDSIEDLDLRNSSQIQNYKSVDDLVKSHNHHMSIVGSSVRIPTEMAGEEDWQKFYSKIGRPDEASSYKLNTPKVPDGMKFDESIKENFSDIAFKNGLRPDQASALFDWMTGTGIDIESQKQQSLTKLREQNMTKIRENWGDEFNLKAKYVNKAINSFLPEHSRERIMTMATNDLDFANMLSAVGEQIGEDSSVGTGDTGSSPQVKTSSDLIKEITAHQMDPKGAYRDRSHPAHKEAVAEVHKLFEQLTSDQPEAVPGATITA
jgi:hypothetical protein